MLARSNSKRRPTSGQRIFEVTRAPLIEAAGALKISNLLPPDWFDALRSEGLAARRLAEDQYKNEPDADVWRSGNPNRYLASARGGEIQTTIYQDPGISVRLGRLTGRALRPTGTEGTYSYYDRPGHHLGLHRDIKTCDVTLITCLERQESDVPSGALRTYPKSAMSALSEIDEHTQFYDIEMTVGQSILLLGGCIPHEVLPVAEGFSRGVSILCFEMIA